jgi:NitT/TauT family transport system ATP-binding protein
MNTQAMDVLITAQDISKAFPLPEGQGTFTVLEGINLSICADEVIALLGRSGSGKSTLLRILAGLIPPTSGTVTSSGKPVVGANPDVAMVFQSFALLPWATVQENVELGLKAQGIPRAQRAARALKAIDMVGLDGFESAYPRELSGGMQQRVGFARAFVMEPKVLFMDEPFSALDVLTAENLRGEIDMLWQEDSFPADSILIVTHNIEEAVLLADRVIILGANPGHIRGEVKIDLPRPRERETERFKQLVDYIYTAMTNPQVEVVSPVQRSTTGKLNPFPHLPMVRAGNMSGLLELIVERGGKEDLPYLGQLTSMSTDELLPIIDGAVLLGFATVEQGDIQVTDVGQAFAEADIEQSKALFRQQLLSHVPLIATMQQKLQEKSNRAVRADLFLDMLEEYYPEEEALRQFETAVDWGRYAELFEYDATERRLTLDS